MANPAGIPPTDLGHQTEPLREALREAIDRVLLSKQFVLGEEVTAFEHEVAAFLGVAHAVGVNSGTDALTIGLHALGIGPGDEVITSPFSFYAAVEAISRCGATPVFADIDPHTFTLTPDSVREAITARTRAVLPVHLYGQAGELDGILDVAARHQLKVVEDACQAFGAHYGERYLGTLGDVGTYSFYPTKNLGAIGDAGLLVTNRNDIADSARHLRNHAQTRRGYHDDIGYNSRLDSIQAAALRVRLPHVSGWNEARRACAARYTERLQDIPGITLPATAPGNRHIFHQYTIRVGGGQRDQLQQAMLGHNIGSVVYYPVPLHQLPMYYNATLILPEAEAAAEEVLSLPLWPDMDEATMEQVVNTLRACVHKLKLPA